MFKPSLNYVIVMSSDHNDDDNIGRISFFCPISITTWQIQDKLNTITVYTTWYCLRPIYRSWYQLIDNIA